MIRELQLCAEIEETVRDIYQFLAETSPCAELGDVWSELADDETEHVNLIRMAGRLDEAVFTGFSQSAGELQALLQKARDVSELIRHRAWSHLDLLEILIGLEREFMQLHAAWIARFSDESMQSLFERLGQGDEKHLVRLKSLAERLRTDDKEV